MLGCGLRCVCPWNFSLLPVCTPMYCTFDPSIHRGWWSYCSTSLSILGFVKWQQLLLVMPCGLCGGQACLALTMELDK